MNKLGSGGALAAPGGLVQQEVVSSKSSTSIN